MGVSSSRIWWFGNCQLWYLQGLHAQGDVDITLCLPHPFGDEDRSACKIVAMNSVPIAWRDVNHDYVQQR